MGLKILSIDDSKAVHAFLKDCLKSMNAELDFALNGKEGLEKVTKVGEGHYQMIILDWEMPVMTGPEFFAEYKKLNKKIPVLMLTSKNQFKDLTQMLDAGVDDYMMKPFTKDIIVEKVKTILKL